MSTSANFLRSVAEYFSAGKTSRPALSTVTFILPNKRSALFLKKYIRDSCRGVTLLPRFMTLSTFVGIYSDFPAAQSRELLFILYDAYRRVMARKGREDDIRQFDSFVFWGDMMLNDFDDIDKSLVEAGDIFRNLKNVKEIQADYLDDDQKEVIRRVWGESRLTAHIEEFWLHLGDGEKCRLGRKFLFLWEILAEIYNEYKAALRSNRRASVGSQYRMAVGNIKKFDSFDFTGDTRYVFVGFNDLTHAETMIFERLRAAGVAYFFWDTAPLTLFAGARGAMMPAPLRRLAELVKNFPQPDDYSVPVADSLPQIDVTSVPSNVAQAKCITAVLKRWAEAGLLDPDNAINTAIVLPDQGLLLPALLSIPEDIKALNISMGLAYRTTTFASLLHAIISMQLRARVIRGEYNFFYEDLNAVLSHPHIQTIAAAHADTITEYVNSHKLYNAPASQLCEKAPELAAIFQPVHRSASVRDVAAYLTRLLDWLGAALMAEMEESGREIGKAFELEAIKFFRDELDKLTALVERYNVEMADHTFLHLFERIFSTRGITLTGTPLKGLQVLGVLETRALDFDNVIILSMNEGIFPRKQYAKTMIPNNLRKGYGLPDFESAEWTYAYSFYRLIARAKRVEIFYDSRSDGMGQGEISRYISQLQYLVPAVNIEEHTLSVGAEASDVNHFSIRKDDKIMSLLNLYKAGGDKKLSASALKKYLECQFRFYLEYVRGLRDNDELSESLSAAEIGTIVHNTIQELYSTHSGRPIDAALIDSWLAEGSTKISDTVIRQVVEVHFGKTSTVDQASFSPELKIAATNLEVLVRSNLEAERDAYCSPSFIFIENEMKVNTLKDEKPWHIADGLDINFFMAIDRVDEIAPGMKRFIDFKTGGDEISVGSIENLFTKYQHKNGGIFQLLLYCEAYLSLREPGVDIQPLLHPLRKLAAATPIKPITVDRKSLTSYRSVREDFRQRLVGLLEELFNPENPFGQCADSEPCTYCPFITLCGRSIKKY